MNYQSFSILTLAKKSVIRQNIPLAMSCKMLVNCSKKLMSNNTKFEYCVGEQGVSLIINPTNIMVYKGKEKRTRILPCVAMASGQVPVGVSNFLPTGTSASTAFVFWVVQCINWFYFLRVAVV